MLLVISSAKTMSEIKREFLPFATQPRFYNEAKEIALNMMQYSVEDLSQILKINLKLATQNYWHFRDFFSEDGFSLPAIYAYTGVVYKNINPDNFTPTDLDIAQKILRIASFGYGLLRPLDSIKPYRMEGYVKMPELTNVNISNYWQDKITETFISDIKNAGDILINLASADIQTAFNWKDIKKATTIITPDFKMWKGGKLKTIVIYAKMARGQMVRYIIKNRITDPEKLKDFSWEGFRYNENLSDEKNWVFLQD